MTNQLLRVLIVEDSADDAELILREVQRGGYTVVSERVETKESMEAALQHNHWDIVLSDYSMPRFSAMAALATLKESGQDIPFLVVSGTIGEETAVAALKAGAHDFLVKDKLARLIPAIERELREAEIRRSHRAAETRYQLLVESLPGIVYIHPLDWAAGPIYASPQIKNILGYSSEEWLADPTFWQSRLHPEDREAALAGIQQSDQTGRPLEIEYRMLAQDGSVVWFRDQAILVRDDQGQPVYWMGLMIDITHRKKA